MIKSTELYIQTFMEIYDIKWLSIIFSTAQNVKLHFMFQNHNKQNNVLHAINVLC